MPKITLMFKLTSEVLLEEGPETREDDPLSGFGKETASRVITLAITKITRESLLTENNFFMKEGKKD